MTDKIMSHYHIVSLDGQRFFMLKTVDHAEAAPTQIQCRAELG
jgi:hypothetical protein